MTEEQGLTIALEAAKAAGASDAYVDVARTREVTLRRRQGRIETSSEATTRSLSVRVWVDGRYGAAATTDLRPEGLPDFVRHLVALTRELEPDPDRRIADPALYPAGPGPELDAADPAVAALDPATREAMLADAASALDADPEVLSASAEIRTADGLLLVASTNGLATRWQGTRVTVSAQATVRDSGDRRSEDHAWATCRHLEDLPRLAALGEEAARRAKERVGSQQGRTRRATMVVEPRAAGTLLRWLVAGAEGSALHQGRSFWLGRLDEPVVSDVLSLTDDPWLPRGLRSRVHDDEGMASGPRAVIEGGALRSPWLDTTYARKLGTSPTNGTPSNLVVRPGERGLDAIVGSVEDGVLVTDWVGGNVSESTGDFSVGLRGFALRGGVRGGPVGEMNASGNLLALFRSLVEVGDEPFRWSPMLSPALVFEDAQLSGC
ncbi:MAG: TldD/PmbA family protein [Alphaproteobacteria bacterium]|nr:TldD/PmbA family protein [Alphaproteobacteria bacterium]